MPFPAKAAERFRVIWGKMAVAHQLRTFPCIVLQWEVAGWVSWTEANGSANAECLPFVALVLILRSPQMTSSLSVISSCISYSEGLSVTVGRLIKPSFLCSPGCLTKI